MYFFKLTVIPITSLNVLQIHCRTNPRVYGTDHEQLFSELENEGPLEDFLNGI